MIRAPGDRRDRGAVETEVLDRLVQLGLDGRDRLADVADLELGELLAVRDDRVGERVQEARALGRRRPAPGAVKRPRVPPRRHGRRPPRRPSPRVPAAHPSRARSRSRTLRRAGSTSSPLMKSPYSRPVATAMPGRYPEPGRSGLLPTGPEGCSTWTSDTVHVEAARIPDRDRLLRSCATRASTRGPSDEV